MWADQLDDYVRNEVGRPVVLCAQGGLAPVALEMWRLGGSTTVAGVSLLSPPPFQFFAAAAASADADATDAPAPRPPSRRKQRAFWLLAQSSVGGFFYRYLRGKGGERIRRFSEANLFADPRCVDDEWVAQCVAGAADTRSRHAVYSYLCGTIPGGVWRDDRSPLLQSLDTPCQLLRGDAVADAEERLAAQVALVPRPSCCALVPNARSVLPWEAARPTAAHLARFLASNFDEAMVDEEVLRKIIEKDEGP